MHRMADGERTIALVNTLASAIRSRLDAQPGTPWVVIGVRSRGEVLARRIGEIIGPQRLAHPVGSLDITLYRDDLSEIGPDAIVRRTDVPMSLDGVNVVLIDDVVMTGRSVRAALQSLMDFGRPARVYLAVLVDRGGRELPIQADDVALDLTGSAPIDSVHHAANATRRDDDPLPRPGQTVQVLLQPFDREDAIVLAEPGETIQGLGPLPAPSRHDTDTPGATADTGGTHG